VSPLVTEKGPTEKVGPTGSEKIGVAVAECPGGDRAVSGGGSSGIAELIDSEMEISHRSWFIIVDNNTNIVVKIHATVYCAAGGQAVAARVPRTTRPLMNERLAELRAEAAAEASAGGSK
jgi:hypothetical protein